VDNGFGLTRRTSISNIPVNRFQPLSDDQLHVFADDLSILPLSVIENNYNLEMALILYSDDQLLCVTGNGSVLWERKLLYLPRPDKKITPIVVPSQARLFAKDSGQAYLVNNVLVVKDNLNVVAYNVFNGAYIWSMTNDPADIASEMIPDLNNDANETIKKYGFSKTFADRLQYHVFFDNGKLILAHQNSILRVDPVTGVVEDSVDLDLPGILQMEINDEVIFILSSDNETLHVISSDFTTLKRIDVQSKKTQSQYSKFFTIDDRRVLIYDSPFLKVLDAKDGTVIDSRPHRRETSYVISQHGSYIFLNDPNGEVIRIGFNNGMIEPLKKNLAENAQILFRKKARKNSKTHFFIDQNIWCFYRQDNALLVAALSNETLDQKWQSELLQESNLLYTISDYLQIEDIIYFIVSTEDSESFAGINPQPHESADLYIASYLIGVDKKNGTQKFFEKLPVMCELGCEDPQIMRWNNNLAYTLNGNHFIVQKAGEPK
jgi:outer membrane protein assembly factor BamB